MYFGSTEVKENGGWEGRWHIIDTSKPPLKKHNLSKQKMAMSRVQRYTSRLLILNLLQKLHKILKRQEFRCTQRIPNCTSKLASTEYNFKGITALRFVVKFREISAKAMKEK